MTTGTRVVTIDTYNNFNRTWNGSDDPVKHRKFNTYSGTTTVMRQSMCDRYSWSPSAKTYVPSSPKAYFSNFNRNLISDIAAIDSLFASTANLKVQAYNDALTKLYSGDFNAAFQAATLNQTLHSVVSLSKGVLGCYRACRRLDINSAIKSLTDGVAGATPRGGIQYASKSQKLVPKTQWHGKDVSQMWLSLQYAWKPMLSDIQSGMEFIDNITADQKLVVHGVAQSKVKYQGPAASTYFVTPRQYYYPPPWTAKRKVRIQFWITRTPTLLEQLGVTDPASIEWELVPFSFVVDWFVPVGDFLRARGLLPFCDKVCYATYFTVYNCDVSNYRGYSWNVFTDYAISNQVRGDILIGGSRSDRKVVLTRQAEALSVPYPDAKSLDRCFSLSHLRNAAALIHQQIQRSR